MYIKKVLFFFILLCINVFVYTEIPLCISLGRACGSVSALRDLSIRTEIYSFDSALSLFPAIYAQLNNDFKDFLTDIQMRPDALTDDYIANNELGITWRDAS